MVHDVYQNQNFLVLDFLVTFTDFHERKNLYPLGHQNKLSQDLSKRRSVTTLQRFSIIIFRSSHPEVFLGKSVLKICSKFTGEHPYRSAISIKLQSNFIEIALWHGCSSVNLLHIFRAPFINNTSEWLLLNITSS